MDIGAGLASLTSAITLTKTLREIDRQFDVAELKAKLADLLVQLSDAKMALIDTGETIKAGELEIARLHEAMRLKVDLREGDGGYSYKASDDGRLFGFPACPKCLALDARQVFLVQDGAINSAKCPVCTTSFVPVTNYLAGGDTAVNQRNERRRAATERDNARISAYNRSIWNR